MTIDVQSATPVQPGSELSGYQDMGDIAFALAAYQLDALDGDIVARLEDMNRLTEIKKAYRERIASLSELVAGMDKATDTVELEGDLATKAEFAFDLTTGKVGSSGTEPVGQGEFVVTDGDGKLYISIGPEMRTSISFDSHDAAVAFAAEHPGSEVHVLANRGDLENEIARLQGKLDDLSGEGEMGLLAINRLMGKRNQVMQLASNVLASSHQTAMGIIGNIR